MKNWNQLTYEEKVEINAECVKLANEKSYSEALEDLKFKFPNVELYDLVNKLNFHFNSKS